MDFDVGKLKLEVERQEKRIEVLERAMMLMLSSSKSYEWVPGLGLKATPDGYNDDVATMILGFTDWNPRDLDKGG